MGRGRRVMDIVGRSCYYCWWICRWWHPELRWGQRYDSHRKTRDGMMSIEWKDGVEEETYCADENPEEIEEEEEERHVDECSREYRGRYSWEAIRLHPLRLGRDEHSSMLHLMSRYGVSLLMMLPRIYLCFRRRRIFTFSVERALLVGDHYDRVQVISSS